MAGAMVIGSAVQAFGSYTAAQARASALDKQAQIQDQNAKLAEQSAQDDATRQQLSADKKIGSITAGYGASGVSSDSGSVMDVLFASHMNSELDRQKIIHGGAIKAASLRAQAMNERSAAGSERDAGLFSILGGGIRAGGSIYANSQSGDNSVNDYGGEG